MFVSVGYENTDLKLPSDNTVQRYQDFVDEEGDQFDTFSVTVGWSSDTRDNAILPTRGLSQNVTAEVATPIGSLQYYKLRYKTSWFTPITNNLTYAMRGELGYGDAYGDTSEFPFFENFYAGGMRSVRGFKSNTLGVKTQDGDENALGGNLLTTAGAELIFPVPFMKKTLRSFRLSAFADVGNVYDIDEDFDAGLLRYSAGVSAIWLSPFGAMTISIAQPFNEQNDDTTENFQFQLGSTF